MTDLITAEFDEIAGPIAMPPGMESKLREEAWCRHNREVYTERLRDAKTVTQMLDAVGATYEPIKGKNRWTETAIKDAFGIEVVPELQEFYSLGIEITSDFWAILTFEHAMRLNSDFRNKRDFSDLYMPFDHLFIFGMSTCGDFFTLAYTKHNDLVPFPIYHWDHETDAREPYGSGDFKDYLAFSFSEYSCP